MIAALCASYVFAPTAAVASSCDYRDDDRHHGRRHNQAPLAHLDNDTVGYVGIAVTLDASKSRDIDGTIVKYQWDTDDNGTWDRETTTPFVSVVFAEAGKQEIRLKVTDNEGASSTDKAWVRIRSDREPPRAVIAAPVSAAVDELVTVDGSGSYDRNGVVVSYAWDFQSDGIVDVTSTSPTTQYAWTEAGVYAIKLTVTDASGKTGSASKPIEITGVTDEAPQPPVDVVAADVTGDDGGAVVVSWTPNTEEDLTGYKVYRAASATGPFTTVVGEPTEATFADSGLTNGEAYFYAVAATDHHGNESLLSAVVSATPLDDAAPAVPADLAVADVAADEGDALDAVWSACTAADLAGYRLTITDTVSSLVETLDVPADTTQHTFSGLVTGRTYTVMVAAYDAAGNMSANSDAVSATPADQLPPAAPSGMTAVDRPDDDGRAILTWWNSNTEADLAGYKIFRTTMPGGVTQQVADVTGVVAWTDENCVDGVSYGYVVYAYDASGNLSEASQVAIAQSYDTLPPLAVTAGAAIDVAGDQGGAVEVTWLPSASADMPSYRVDCLDGAGVVVDSADTGFALSHTFTGLETGEPYTFLVYASDSVGNVSPASPAFAATPLDNLAPAAPADVAATDIVPDDGGAISLAWTANTESDLGGYVVTCYAADDSVVEVRDVGFATNPTFSGLDSSQLYSFDAVAYDVNGNDSPASARVSAQGADEVAPDAVTLEAADKPADQGGVVELTWGASAAADTAGYKVFRDAAEIANVTVLAFTDAVGDNLPHTYSVKAYDESGNLSDESVPVTVAAVDNLAPAAATAVTAADVAADEGGAILVAYTRSADTDVDGYHLYCYAADDSLVAQATVAALDESYVFSGLTDGVQYGFEVVAFDTSGNLADPSDRAFAAAVDNLAPVAPIGVTATDIPNDDGGVISINWEAVVDAAAYRVYRSEVSGSGYALLGESTTLSLLDTNAPSGTTFYYVVTAVDAAGNESVASAQATGISEGYALDVTPPTAPALAVSAVGDGFVSLEWAGATDNVGVTGYEVWMKQNIVGEWVKQADITGTAYTKGALVNGMTYFFKVNAKDEAGNVSAFSSDTPGVPARRMGQVSMRIEQTDPAISWYGVWQNWGPDPAFSGGSTKYTNATGARSTLTFSGTGVTVAAVGATTGNRGIANVYVDGVRVTQLDLYTYYGNFQQALYEVSGLAPGIHTITLEVSGQKNVQSGGTYLDIDAFDIEGDVADLGPISPPATVTAVDRVGDQGDGLNVSWSASPEADVTGYSVYRATSVAGPFTLLRQVVGTSFTDTGLTTGISYYYKIAAHDAAANQSVMSGAASGIPRDNNAPAMPTDVQAADTPGDTGGAITISWTSSADPDTTRYSVFRATTLTGTYAKIADVTGTSMVDTGRINGAVYYYKVQAFDASNNGSAMTAPVSASAADNTPGQAVGLTGLAGDGYASLAWGLSGGAVTSYEVWMKTGSGEYEKMADIATTSYSKAMLENGVTYTFKVRAMNGTLPGAFSAEEAVLPVADTGQPVLTIIEDTDSSITWAGTWVHWGPDPAFSGGTSRYSNTPGSRASLTFSGTGVTVKAKCLTAGNRGMANIYVDGVYQTTVDLYTYYGVWHSTIFETSGLSDQQHTLTIEVANEKNVSSAGYVVDIDCFEVLHD